MILSEMPPAGDNTAAPADVREVARSYLRGGRAPVPVAPNAKHPTLPDWPNLRVSDRDIDRLFDPDDNIGLLLGEPSAGLVDVDLDSSEARRAAAILLPPTGMISGRESAPDSHWWYHVDYPPPTASEKLFDPAVDSRDKNGLLLELRSTGAQSVVPPSTYPADPDAGHPSPERCVWLRASEPAGVTINDLRAAVRATRAAAAIGRHWPQGARHDAALVLTGGLLRDKLDVERASTFMTTVCAAAEDEEVKARVRSVVDTAAKMTDRDQRTTGWGRLIGLLGPHGEIIVGAVRRGLGLKSPRGRRPGPMPRVPFPTHALPEPWRTFVRQAARALGCDEGYLAPGVLAVIAGAIGNTRRVHLGREWYEPDVVWGVLIAESGTLKSPALALVTDLLRERQKELIKHHKVDLQQFRQDLRAYKGREKAAARDGNDPGDPPDPPRLRRMYCSDVTIERLAGILAENPRGVVAVRDELAGWFGSFTRYKAGGGTDLPNWLEMHRAGNITVDRKTGDEKFVFVPHTAASVVGSIQPGVFLDRMTPEFFECGLVARMLLAMPPARPEVWTDAELDPQVKAAAGQNLDQLLALEFGVGAAADGGDPDLVPVVLSLTPAAKAEWVAFYNEWARKQADAEGNLAAALSKLEGYAARLALLHHVVSTAGSGAYGRIDAASVRAGIALARWFGREADRVYRLVGESADDRATRRAVEAVERLAATRPGGVSPRDLHRASPSRHPTAEAAEAVMESLVGLGVAEWVEAGPTDRGGRPTRRLQLTHDETDAPPARHGRGRGRH